MCKAYNLPPREVLKMSYTNVRMYGAVLAEGKKEEKEDTFREDLDANNPNNFR